MHKQIKPAANLLLQVLALGAVMAGRATSGASPLSTEPGGADGHVRPPTTLQAAVPAPAFAVPKPDAPIRVSRGASALGAAAASGPLTIERAIAIALSTNASLATAAQSLMEAQGATTATRAGQGLTASANYSLTRNNQQQASEIGGQTLVIQKQYVSAATVALSVPLDVTGALHAATTQAQFNELAARLDLNRVRNEVVLQVKTAFYNVLRKHALVTVAETSLSNAQSQLADAELRHSAGTVTRYDVLSAETGLFSTRQTLRENRNALSQALATLSNTIGLDVNTSLQITTEGAVEVPPTVAESETWPSGAPNPAAAENSLRATPGQPLGDLGAASASSLRSFVVGNTEPLGPEYDRLLAEAMCTRPEIARENASISAARKGIAVAKSGVLPSVSLGYQVSFTPDASGISTQTTTGYAILNVSLPLFDAGATRGKVKEAHSKLAAAETSRRAEVDAVALELRQAWLNLQQYQEQVASARQELAQADEAYRLAQLRYSAGVTSQAGVSPLIELSNAQKSLAQAQTDYVNALYDYNNGRSALDKAVGRYAQSTAPKR